MIATPLSRVVGPLPNGRTLWLKKTGLLTKWDDPPIRPVFFGGKRDLPPTYQGFLGSCMSADPLLLWGHGMQADLPWALGFSKKKMSLLKSRWKKKTPRENQLMFQTSDMRVC